MTARRAPPPQSATTGRLLILTAAILWSTSGVFVPLLRSKTPLGLHVPEVLPWHIAFFRVFFAGAVLVPLVKRRDVTWRPAMLFTALWFAAMNVMFTLAMSLGKTSDAIMLQNTAPMWMFLACVTVLGEPADRRSLVAVLIGLLGVGVIVWGGWKGEQLHIVLLALGSGFAYAMVMLGLRVMRDESPRWVTVWNHLTAALVLVPVLWIFPIPTWPQLLVLALFGALQLGLPYVLMARGLKSISPQEAGTLVLLEPVLNTLWAWLIAPEQQTPSVYTLVGGAVILGALFWRYAPFGRRGLQK
jgi:drug/metabolite transporter (DMT)-like permease